jgi:hypothetical protein
MAKATISRPALKLRNDCLQSSSCRRQPQVKLVLINVNEQPYSYWMNKFKQNHCDFEEIASRQLSLHWKASNVAACFHGNIMIFVRC